MLTTEKKRMLNMACTIYSFGQKDDELPVHVHTKPEHNHITIVMSGAIRCIGTPGIDGDVLFPGDCRDWPLNVEHGFIAIEPDSRILNISKAESAT